MDLINELRIVSLLKKACEMKASDLHIHVNEKPRVRILSFIEILTNEAIVDEKDMMAFLDELKIKEDKMKQFNHTGSLDAAYYNPQLGNFRVNFFYQQAKLALSIRILPSSIPQFDELNLYPQIKDCINRKSGLVLITGITGNGKSTTIASLINIINQTQPKHIITIEDPIEYHYQSQMSIISQREVGTDCNSFDEALRSSLRQDPDIIVIGEMRDKETIQIAIEAAESGHLVFSTLHTSSASSTVERIISYFEGDEQKFTRFKLASVLVMVMTQQLVLSIDEKTLYPAQEVMFCINPIQALIRDGKCYQINNFLQTNKKDGLITMEESLARLVIDKKITLEKAYASCNDLEILKLYLRQDKQYRNIL